MQMVIDNISIETNIEDEAEIRAYIERAGKTADGRMVRSMKIIADGEYVGIETHYTRRPFERIRRITGYLVGTVERFNNGKRAEEHDRVKHGTEVLTNAKDDYTIGDRA